MCPTHDNVFVIDKQEMIVSKYRMWYHMSIESDAEIFKRDVQTHPSFVSCSDVESTTTREWWWTVWSHPVKR